MPPRWPVSWVYVGLASGPARLISLSSNSVLVLYILPLKCHCLWVRILYWFRAYSSLKCHCLSVLVSCILPLKYHCLGSNSVLVLSYNAIVIVLGRFCTGFVVQCHWYEYPLHAGTLSYSTTQRSGQSRRRGTPGFGFKSRREHADFFVHCLLLFFFFFFPSLSSFLFPPFKPHWPPTRCALGLPPH